jgi:DNA-binding GntR family transcriptional regulator
LREKILRGQLPPGARIMEGSLSRELRVGQPTVREALLRLERGGLVRRVPNLGTFVIELDAPEVRDLFQIRSQLEVLAIRLAAANATPGDVGELYRAAAKMVDAAAARDLWAYLRNDLEFHTRIWNLSGNRRLAPALDAVVTPLLAVLSRKIERSDQEVKRAAQAHRALVDALARGPDAAAQAMREHIGLFFDNYMTRTLFQGVPRGDWKGFL